MVARRFSPFLLTLVLGWSACRPAQVTSYRVPKENDPELPAGAGDASTGAAAAAPGGAMANAAVPTAAGPDLVWSAPESWSAKPATAMRKGSYTVAGADGNTGDLSVTAFPGDVGGTLANINRWRGQVQLAPLAEADLANSVTHQTIHGLSFTIVDLSGPGASSRILGALVPFGEGTWFFKLIGPAEFIERQKPAFLAFLETVKPAGSP